MKLSTFFNCEKGSISVAFALTALPVCLAAGAGIDYSRIVSVQTASQAALDSALLAAAALPTFDRAARFESFFTQNSKTINATFNGFQLTKDSDGTFKASVDATIPLTFMKLAGMENVKMTLNSEGQGIAIKKLSEVTFKTTGAKGIYDKDIYFVTRDSHGNILTRDLVLRYDWRGPGLAASFSPRVENEFTMNVPDYSSWAVELVVFADQSFKGDRINENNHFSDGPDADKWQKVSGECDDPNGQTQSWEDLGDADYADFSFTLKCTKVTEQTGVVRLIK